MKKVRKHRPQDRLKDIWRGMLRRCYDSSFTKYRYYGGRGIYVCDEWRDSFESFEQWAISHGYDASLTLDRIDNDQGYSPDNCRWADIFTQRNNTRANCYLLVNGEKRTLAEWSRKSGVNYDTLRSRIFRYGWNPERAVSIRVDTVRSTS